MQYRRIAALLLIVALPSTYAAESDSAPGQSAPQPGASIQSLRFTPQFKTGLGHDVDPAQLPDKIIFAFRLDPGWVIGGSRSAGASRDLQGFTLNSDEPVIDLASWIRVANASAKPLTKKDTKRGVSVTPAETRLASVYQFAYSPGSGRLGGRYLGRYSVLRDADGRNLPLVFFDRPCRVAGRIQLKNEEQTIAHVAIDIPGPGFYFLRYVSRPNDEAGLVVGPSLSEVVFVTQF